MNKKELINAVAEQSGLTKSDSTKALNAVIDQITYALTRGEDVSIPRFASLKPVVRAPRTGVNPSTGESMEIPSKTVVKFKAGSELAGAVHESKAGGIARMKATPMFRGKK